MGLYVDNIAAETVNVCFVIYDPSCGGVGGQPWRKVAWYVITPGSTILPDIFNADLNKTSAGYSGNRYAYLYAYTASDDKEWQGTGNAWVEVSGGVHFNQCIEDEANCVKWVDFEGMDFAGQATDIVYIGWPSASGIFTTTPAISVDPGEGEFYLSGSGFSSDSTVSILYTYTDDNGDLTQATYQAGTSGYGNVADTVPVSTLLGPGTLEVQVTDENHPALSATTTVTF